MNSLENEGQNISMSNEKAIKEQTNLPEEEFQRFEIGRAHV